MLKYLRLLPLLFASLAFGQTAASSPAIGNQWHSPLGYVPSSSTAITTASSTITFLHLDNTSASSVAITIIDSSTNCGGAACAIWSAVPIPGNTAWEVPMYGLVATGGIKWSAGTGSAVTGWMTGYYVKALP